MYVPIFRLIFFLLATWISSQEFVNMVISSHIVEVKTFCFEVLVNVQTGNKNNIDWLY